jgi:hypothetical protein
VGPPLQERPGRTAGAEWVVVAARRDRVDAAVRAETPICTKVVLVFRSDENRAFRGTLVRADDDDRLAVALEWTDGGRGDDLRALQRPGSRSRPSARPCEVGSMLAIVRSTQHGPAGQRRAVVAPLHVAIHAAAMILGVPSPSRSASTGGAMKPRWRRLKRSRFAGAERGSLVTKPGGASFPIPRSLPGERSATISTRPSPSRSAAARTVADRSL